MTADIDMVSLPIDTWRSPLHNSRFAPTVQQSNLSSLVHGSGTKASDGRGVGGGTTFGGDVAFADFAEVGLYVLLLDFAEDGEEVGGGVGGGEGGEVGGEVGGGGQSTLQPEDGSHPYQSSLPDQDDFPLLDQPPHSSSEGQLLFGDHTFLPLLPLLQAPLLPLLLLPLLPLLQAPLLPLLPLLHECQAPLLPLLPLLQASQAPLLPLLPLLQASQAPLLPLLPLLQASQAPLLPLLPLLQASQAPLLPLLPLLQAYQATSLPLLPEDPPQLSESSYPPHAHDQSSVPPHAHAQSSLPSRAVLAPASASTADGDLLLIN